MLIFNWPFNKITFFALEANVFFKSFLNMYSKTPLPSRETVPLKTKKLRAPQKNLPN